MRALVLEKADGPSSALVRDEARPVVGPGEVRVILRAASLNHRELWISRGLYPGMKLPCILGADGAGIVAELGQGVDATLIGREVVLYPGRGWGNDRRFPSRHFALLGVPLPGTIAEEIVVSAESVFDKPPHLSFEEAACLPTAAITAWRGLVGKAGLKAGEKLLVTGTGGGVATYALMFGHALRADVYVTSSSAETLAKAAALGAKAGFNYREAGWRKALQAASGGVDVVFDGAPAGALGEYSRALATGGRIVIYGSTGGTEMAMAAPDLFLRHATIYGTAMGDLIDFADMLAFVTKHSIKPIIERSMPLAEASHALQYLEKNHTFGKIVISI